VYLNSEIARQELAHLSRGKRSRIPVNVLAEFVLNYCTPNATPVSDPLGDSLQFLERLFALEEPRD
jgi:hypothetical protein